MQRDSRDPAARRGGRGNAGASALADDHPALAEGMDRAKGSRRPQGGGLLASAPGAGARRAIQSGASAHRRAVDAQLPARGALRRARRAGAGTARAAARRQIAA